MSFVDPDENSFVDPDEDVKPVNDPQGWKAAYKKYKKEYDTLAAAPRIPGEQLPPLMSEEEWLKDKDATYKDKLLGIPETALSFLTSIPAMINAAPPAIYKSITEGSKAGEADFGRLLEKNTYTPRTESGQKNVEALGYALQPFALSPYAAKHTLSISPEIRNMGIHHPEESRDTVLVMVYLQVF